MLTETCKIKLSENCPETDKNPLISALDGL